MSARAFLVRGLIAGLIAGFATFLVAYAVGEPHVEAAISLEDGGAHADGHTHTHSHDHGDSGDSDEDAGPVVSREHQKTWGLLTGTLTVGLALGGVIGLVAAGTLGRLGRLCAGQSTALVALLGFVSFALVPFLKYPASPPGVGHGDTIGHRTTLYFCFVALSVVVAVLAVAASLRLRERLGDFGSVLAGVAGYLAVMVAAGQAFATVDEVGDFPGDTLWFFRRDSLIILAVMWAVLGVVLTGLVRRLYAAERATAERRALAASL